MPTSRRAAAGHRGQHEQERERLQEGRRGVGDAVGSPSTGLQRGEVEGEEDVLDHDDAEDEAASRGWSSRRSSTSSLVTMADDEMPIAPAMTSASLVPQPRAKPKARPPPTLSAR